MRYGLTILRLGLAASLAGAAPAHAELTFTGAEISLATDARTPAGSPDSGPHPNASSTSTATPANLTLGESSGVINGNPISSFANSRVDAGATFLNGGLSGLFEADTTLDVYDPFLFAFVNASYEFVYRFDLSTVSGFEGFYSLTPTDARTASTLSLTGPSGFAGMTGQTGSQFLSLLPGSYELRFSSAFALRGVVETEAMNDAYSFRITPTIAPPPPGVPEPGTWALLILGFGVVGAESRRRRGNLSTNSLLERRIFLDHPATPLPGPKTRPAAKPPPLQPFRRLAWKALRAVFALRMRNLPSASFAKVVIMAR